MDWKLPNIRPLLLRTLVCSAVMVAGSPIKSRPDDAAMLRLIYLLQVFDRGREAMMQREDSGRVASHKLFRLAFDLRPTYHEIDRAHPPIACPHNHPHPQGLVEETMELRMRLNVLAAIMSFAFVAAIALGMV
jgi:hypothetical protein